MESQQSRGNLGLQGKAVLKHTCIYRKCMPISTSPFPLLRENGGSWKGSLGTTESIEPKLGEEYIAASTLESSQAVTVKTALRIVLGG